MSQKLLIPILNQQLKKRYQCCGLWTSFSINNKLPSPQKIILSNKKNLELKLQKMRQDGIQNLQVLSDFDHTITGFGPKENKYYASFEIISKSQYVCNEFKTNQLNLYKKYHPYELDLDISNDFKQQMMHQWNVELEQLFRKAKISRKILNQSLNTSPLSLRYFFREFFMECQNINIPFYIISGGISPFIISCLNAIIENVEKYKNLFIFCNEGHFNENEELYKVSMKVNTSTKEEMVNKNQFFLLKNALILGDFHHDSSMKNGLDCENILSIMFVREDISEKNIQILKKDWDILIIGEGNFIIHQIILQYISQNLYFKPICNEFYSNNIYSEIRQLINA